MVGPGSDVFTKDNVGFGLGDAYEQASRAYETYGDETRSCANVHSISMAPAIFPGNVACYAEYDKSSKAEEGDIIIFWDNEGDAIIHAIIAKKIINGSAEYLTKGYNNAKADPYPVNEDQIIGVVTEVRYT